MFNPLTLDAPYDVNQIWHGLPVYQTSQGLDEMVELAKTIQESGNYYWQGIAFPGQSDTTVAALTTVNGSIQVPAGTYVLAINAYASNEVGFKFKLYDKGTKASIFYGDYSHQRIVTSNMQIQYGVGASNPPTDAGMNADNPFGPAWLLSPFIVTPPGVLGWEIVNLASASATIQLMLSSAVPINAQSIGNMIVTRG